MSFDLITAIAVLYIILNGISLSLYGVDKRKAVKDRYRIKESTLLTVAFLGPFGALAGMKAFRHKTQKAKFKLVYLFVALHLILIAFTVWKFLT